MLRWAVFTLFLIGAASGTLHTAYKSKIFLTGAASVNIADEYPGSDGPALLVSTYGINFLGGNPSYAIPDLKQAAAGNASQQQQIESSEKWSNWIEMAPSSVGPNLVVIAGGFLIPVAGINTGTVCLFDVSDPANVIKTKISTDKSGWFYHKVVWFDMNGDGKLDLVTARAHAPADPAGELVWFEQPTDGAYSNATYTATSAWAEHIAAVGPDVDFIFEDLDGDGKPEAVATQFFSAPVLAVYSCPEASWHLCNKENVKQSVIDDVGGPFFAVQRSDLNGDGKMDLLVTNNQDNAGSDGTGSVFAYEQPAAGITGKWTKHVLATGFIPNPTTLPSQGPHSRGSPGRSTAFQAKTSAKGKPQILVSGDDAGTISILTAVSEDSNSWDYSQAWMLNSTGTIGSPAVGDVDNDGFADIFVPMYTANRVEVYSFQEAPGPVVAKQCYPCLLKKDPVGYSPDSSWCFKDGNCYIVNDPTNPCDKHNCASAAKLSSCECSSCNDGACRGY